jgi:type I restriction enzyme S subunit
MSAVPTNKKRERQSANEAPARHSGAGRNPASSSFRTPRSGDPESSFSVLREAVALVPLGQVADINPRFGKDELADDMLATFVPMKCVEEESGRFAPLEDRKVGEVRKGYTSFRDGDVIFAKVTPCMENGKAAVVSGLTNGVGFGSTEFFVLRPSERIDPKYLLHFVLQQSFRKEAARNMTGAVGLRRVPKPWLEQQRIPLPSIALQRQIVAEIEKQFTRLDAGVAALRRVQANLKRYRAAVLKAACEGRLVPTEAELAKAEGRTYETGEQLLARIFADRRKNWHGRGKYKEPVAPDATTLPQLPDGWVWASLDQLLELMRNGISAKPDGTSGLPILRISAVRPLSVNLEDIRYLKARVSDYPDYVLAAGDLLFTRYNGNADLVGVCGVVPIHALPLVHPDKLIRCSLVASGALPQFVAMMANVGTSRDYLARRVRTTAGQAGISGGDLKGQPIPVPPAAEQSRIVAEVERRLSVIEELDAAVTDDLKRATRLRQSILSKAFTISRERSDAIPR